MVNRNRFGQIERKVARLTTLLEEAYGLPPKRREEDPLEILIQTILSQNTNDRNRDRAYERLRQRFATWEAVMEASLEGLVRTIRVAGLAHQKARRIQDVLRWVQGRFGKLDLDGLRSITNEGIEETMGGLKGIGPKTLHCLLLFGLGREAFPVDTHILRVGKRIGFIPRGMGAAEAHRWMAPFVPEGRSLSLHLHLIRFGRSVCQARKPRCECCFLTKECDAYTKRPKKLGAERMLR